MVNEALGDSARVALVGTACLAAFFALIHAALGRVAGKAVALMVAPISATLCVTLFLCATLPSRFGGMDSVFAFCYVAFLAGLVGIFVVIVRERADWPSVAIFLACAFLMTFVTLLMRDGGTNERIIVDPLAAFRNGSVLEVEPIRHFLLNVALFIPFGAFGYLCADDEKRRIFLMISAGILASTTVESTQLIFKLGTCDLGDVLSNSIGATIGALCAIPFEELWRRTVGGYEIEYDYEEEDEEEPKS